MQMDAQLVQLVDGLMEAARGHGEAHADDDVTEWSTGVMAQRAALLIHATSLAKKKTKKPTTMWKLISRYVEAARQLPEDAYEDESRYGDSLAAAAELQLEIRRRLKRTSKTYPMAGAILDGMDLS